MSVRTAGGALREAASCVRGSSPGFVGDPLLVDVVVQPREHPHHLAFTGAHHDVAAHGVQDVDRLRGSERIKQR